MSILGSMGMGDKRVVMNKICEVEDNNVQHITATQIQQQRTYHIKGYYRINKIDYDFEANVTTDNPMYVQYIKKYKIKSPIPDYLEVSARLTNFFQDLFNDKQYIICSFCSSI